MTGSGKPDTGARHATPTTTGQAQAQAAHDKRAPAGLTPEIQNRIGTQLQSLYNDLLAEETPDRFLKLLDELDKRSPDPASP